MDTTDGLQLETRVQERLEQDNRAGGDEVETGSLTLIVQ